MQSSFQHTDKELLLKVAGGDEMAFAELFHAYRDQVFSAAWKITGVRAAAEDVVQEVFMKVWLHRKTLVDVNNFGAWLHTIAKHHIFNQLRKVANEHSVLKELLQTTTSDTSNLHQVHFHELQNLLHRAIAQLPAQQQRVYLLSREENLKYHEIAARLQIAPATVKTHMIEALRSIRENLLGNGIEITLPVVIIMAAQA